MESIIRPAQLSEIDTMLEIQASYERRCDDGFLVSGYSAEEFRRFISDSDTTVHCVTMGERLAGYCIVSNIHTYDALVAQSRTKPRNTAPHARYVTQIAVSTTHLRKGLGTRLLRAATLESNTIVTDVVWKPVHNRRSHSFFLAHGFTELGHLELESYRDSAAISSIVLQWQHHL